MARLGLHASSAPGTARWSWACAAAPARTSTSTRWRTSSPRPRRSSARCPTRGRCTTPQTGALVGFAMISDNIPPPMDDDLVGPYFPWKLLIGHQFQGRGYGAGVRRPVRYRRTRPRLTGGTGGGLGPMPKSRPWKVLASITSDRYRPARSGSRWPGGICGGEVPAHGEQEHLDVGGAGNVVAGRGRGERLGARGQHRCDPGRAGLPGEQGRRLRRGGEFLCEPLLDAADIGRDEFRAGPVHEHQ